MLHLLFDNRPWFRAKSHGYGAGRPIAWQGWLMMGLHIGLIVGVMRLSRDFPGVMAVLVLFIALAPLPLYHARTEGGWHWRWGRRDRH